MAKLLSNVISIQNEIVRLKQDIKSFSGQKLQSIETRLSAYLKLQAAGGRAPTKRDALGNVLLYEDILLPGSQLQRADQYITVDMIKPDYDDAQAKEVLNTEINELFTSVDASEVARLRQQIEDLRQQLKYSQASITLQGTGGGGDDKQIIFPLNAVVLPDATTGEISSTQLIVDINTAIFNDADMKLIQFGAGNPFSISWWIIDHNNGQVYLQGVDDTYIGSINKNTQLGDKDLDVVLKLTTTPVNFSGWYIQDNSAITQFKLVNFSKISNDDVIKFRFIRRHNLGNSFLDTYRNTYYVVASFLNEAPKFI